MLHPVVNAETPLIGLGPSAILSFRDEYPELVGKELVGAAQDIAKHCFLFEEWVAREIDKGNITPGQFNTEKRKVLVHGHCHQKALSSTSYIIQ